MRIDLRAFQPAPSKLIANLPYGIATAVLLRTIDELASVGRWVVMVQREVGERLAARPGSGAYGASSVIVQLACEVKVLRAIPRTVFQPVPNVDSVLVELRRHGIRRETPADARPNPPAAASVRALVYGAFAHRRKTLAGSLALAAAAAPQPPGWADASRERIREALVELGHRPDVRAERLSPQEFVELARALAA
jgi:16S rRNA (adenine1518-N6/adenine1519-N6)-dimethyltransferase